MSFRDPPSPEEADGIDTSPQVLEDDLSELERRLAPFSTEAWDQIAAELAAELARQTDQLIGGALSTDQVFQVRGRAQALRWSLDLPRQIRADMAMLGEQLRALVSTEEGE